MTIPLFDSPESAFAFVRLAVFRSNRYLLDERAHPEVIAQLTAAFETLESENRAEEYSGLVQTYVNRLIAELPCNDDFEYRGGDRPTNALPPTLPPANLADALRSICPLWPFC